MLRDRESVIITDSISSMDAFQTGQRRLSSGARQEDRGAKSLVSRLTVASGWVLIGVHEQKKLDLWEKHTWHVRC